MVEGMVYDVSAELLDSPALIALVHEQALADAAIKGATRDFRFLVFKCRGGDTTCPLFPGVTAHGHAFWKGYTDG